MKIGIKGGIIAVLLSLIAQFTMAQSGNPCAGAQAFHIVVLGSSTAAGAGPSSPDSTWVNRYRAHLQSINAGNQVTNLAVGGFTTYRLMPTGYTPPGSRPAPDTTKNITKGLSLNPDAIIINMPSNDVSNGYTVAEQLHNFDTIIGLATLAGVPVWISTTQPKNYGSQTNINKQIEVRDSIYARYGTKAIDFWTTIATPGGTIDSAYDSGDGTHLNNAGHRILFSRVAAKDIPAELYLAPNNPDMAMTKIEPLFLPTCGDSVSQFKAEIANLGLSLGIPYLAAELTHLGTAQVQNLIHNFPNSISSCTTDSALFSFNTSLAGDYALKMWTFLFADPNPSNDTLTYFFSTLGKPTLMPISDTACAQTSLQLEAIVDPQDTVFWYDALVGGNLVGNGLTFQTPLLSSSATWYAEAIRGPLYFVDALTTTTNSNINWNGGMLDLVAQTDLTIDSFGLKINSLGTQAVGVYMKAGSHVGAQTNAGAWTFLGSRTVQVSNANVLTNIPLGGISIMSGDTVGLYFYLINGASNLSYQSGVSVNSRSDGQLEIITGSGVSAGFSATFYPRDINAQMFYHHGSRPQGDCSTGRIPVEAVVSIPQVSLPADTIIDVNGSIALDAGAGFVQYAWSTGATTQTLTLTGAQLGNGIHIVTVSVTDANGCTASDDIIVGVANLVGIEARSALAWQLSPNPARDVLQIEWLGQEDAGQLQLRDALGNIVFETQLEAFVGAYQMSLQDFAGGVYFVEWRTEDVVLRKKVLVVK